MNFGNKDNLDLRAIVSILVDLILDDFERRLNDPKACDI
jgi:hypothetical protein